MRVLLIFAFLLSFLCDVTALMSQDAQSPSPRNEIYVLSIDGVINPLSSRYLLREIERGEKSRAQGLLLKLNTPGGLESSMRKMSQAILNSSVPVIVYVTPAGGRAASAGMFLVLSAHVAAMAPGTNIGAAHPVQLGGGDKGEKKEVTDKAVNDAAALARAIAEKTGRNASWAEQAVKQSVSITANEAKQKGVVDLVSPSVDELLHSLSGRSFAMAKGQSSLKTAPGEYELVDRPMSWPERLLHVITDPNIAYLLMSIGLIGVIAELYSPGLLFPGITGVLSLLLAFVSLGSLPIGWAGIILIALGIGLFIVELNSEGFGVLGIGGIVAFVLGSLLLYRPITPVSPALPQVRVSPWLIAATSAFLAAFMGVVLRAVLKTRHTPVATGAPALVGSHGVLESDLSPLGTVRVDSEKWTATVDPTSQDSHLSKGESVEVTGVEGVTLIVRKSPLIAKSLPALGGRK